MNSITITLPLPERALSPTRECIGAARRRL